MASAFAFLIKKRYEAIVAENIEKEKRRKEKPVKIPPPPESTEHTAVWFWKLRDLPVTVMLDKDNKEVWCNGEVLTCKKTVATGTCERPGMSFQIKLPNVEVKGEEKKPQARNGPPKRASVRLLPVSADDIDLKMSDQKSEENVEVKMEKEEVGEVKMEREEVVEVIMERNENADNMDDSVYFSDGQIATTCVDVGIDAYMSANNDDHTNITSVSEGQGCFTMSSGQSSISSQRPPHIEKLQQLIKDDDNSTSSCDSLYFDASDDATMADSSKLNNFPCAEHLTQDASDDSGYEMAEEVPKFFYHDARIRHFVFGEHVVFELYVDGCMIQEHTKELINCTHTKNDVAKKKD